MQIGEFARICNTKITVLRHYDKEGLLEPDYVDAFTGYRYYSDAQIPIFFRITALKQAGFSLAQIKKILASCENNDALLALFEQKQAELMRMVTELEEARKIILREEKIFEVTFFQENGGTWAKSTIFNGNVLIQAREMMESTLSAKRYQRISAYRVQSVPNSGNAYLVCQVMPLNMFAVNIHESVAIPFENDESVVGKWGIIGEYAVKEDFFEGVTKGGATVSEQLQDIYFLPEGKRYWCYGWTKGFLFCRSDGGNTTANCYTLETIGNELYMFVELKSYEYLYGGKPTVLVLKQIDHKKYCEEDIRKRDDVNKPFISDPYVLGNWKAFGFTKTIERFDPNEKEKYSLSLLSISFDENGEAVLYHRNLKYEGGLPEYCHFTKGFLLRKDLACAYEIQNIDGKDYLFMEWKNGDYIYGGRKPQYYVFTRE
jgi:DNA-binding transcriptional MerR regulator